jgi:hypothetical protein
MTLGTKLAILAVIGVVALIIELNVVSKGSGNLIVGGMLLAMSITSLVAFGTEDGMKKIPGGRWGFIVLMLVGLLVVIANLV